ncbi:MAG: phosphoribosyltransferase [bacterium]|nr:phosphoribosyltransferase [bacterium]
MKNITPRENTYLKSLAKQCNALYICPKNAEGKRTGTLVPYAGKDAKGRNLVGDCYFNFRRIEENVGAVIDFAKAIRDALVENGLMDSFDTVCGIPQGGRTLAQEVAWLTNRRFVYADKKAKPAEASKKQEYDWDLSQFSFKAGERLLVVDDLLNNLQNTDNTLEQIAKTGAQVVLLGTALNRSPFADKSYTPKSGPYEGQVLPIVAAIREPYPEYEQDDPEVASDIACGNIEWEVKKNWGRLMAVMNIGRPLERGVIKLEWLLHEDNRLTAYK